jgi:hypothetical protein
MWSLNVHVSTNIDDEKEDEAEEVLPSTVLTSSDLGKQCVVHHRDLKLTYRNTSGRPSSLARVSHRDPEDYFSSLSQAEKSKLIYRTDLGIYGPDNEEVGFDDLPDLLTVGSLVIVDVNFF